MNLQVRASDRNRIRAFYRDVLGCQMTRSSETIDIFETRNGSFFGFTYADDAQGDQERLRSIRLEFRTDNAEELKAKILKSGLVATNDVRREVYAQRSWQSATSRPPPLTRLRGWLQPRSSRVF
jgi:hypothetical protein